MHDANLPGTDIGSTSQPLSETWAGVVAPQNDPAAVDAHFRAWVLDGRFPCLGASSAVRHGDYILHTCPPLGTEAGAQACLHALDETIAAFPVDSHPVTILVAVFDGPWDVDENKFEEMLWLHLNFLREQTPLASMSGSAPLAGRDFEDPGFAFADRDFFIVGMHPRASRIARRFRWPTLVFNALTHSQKLRDDGHYDLMRDRIRNRDLRLQGTLNPTLDLPQLAQFSGRAVGSDWRCPLAKGGIS